MSSWNDVISTYGGGELSYSFPESTIATLRLYAKLGGGDYTGSIILRVSDGSSHHLQLEGSSADTLKIVEYPGESIIVDNIRAHKMDWQQVVIVLTPVGIRVYQNGSLTGSGYISSPLAFTQLLFYADQAQLYDELTHIPAEVSEAQIERWGLQDCSMITADPGGYYEEQFALGTIEEPTGEWLSNPPETDVTEYLWMRRRWVAGDGTPGSWATPVRIKGDKGETGDIGPEGPQGPMGNPGQLGLYADGTTLYLKGFAEDGTLTAEHGNIYGDGQRLVVPAYSQELTADGQGYVIFDGSTVQFAKLIADGASKRWIPYNGGDSIDEDFWVIGSFTKDGSSIYSLQIVFPERSQQFERSHFMDILASGDMGNITKWAEANGVGPVFEKIAAYEIFTNALSANEAFTANLKAVNVTAGYGNGSTGGFRFRAMSDRDMDGGNIPVFDVMYNSNELFKVDIETGKIYFGAHFWYDPADGAIHTPNNKTVIKADGTIEAVDGSFTGNIVANSGLFKGIFDTTALRLEPGDATVVSKYVDNNYNQALDLYDYFVTSQGLSDSVYYKISSPTSGSLTFSPTYYDTIYFSGTGINVAKYITFTILNGVYKRVIFYNSAYELIGMVIKRVDGSTTGQVKINSSFTLGVSYGGDKLIVSSDIPTDTNGLDDYQIYLSGDTLKVKLP